MFSLLVIAGIREILFVGRGGDGWVVGIGFDYEVFGFVFFCLEFMVWF